MTDNSIISFRKRTSKAGVRKPKGAWHDRMRSMLAEEALREEEAKAIVDEREFIRRFCAPWPRRDREALLDFQREVNLSDYEIRWLMRSKSLSVRDRGIAVSDPVWMRLMGWFYIGALWFILGISMLRGAELTGFSDRSMVLLGAGSLVLLAVSRFLWLFLLLPHSVAARAGRLREFQSCPVGPRAKGNSHSDPRF